MSQPVSHVHTITAVAEMLGESEELLWELSEEMDARDGRIWIGDSGGKETCAFTQDGIARLTELLEEHEDNPAKLLRRTRQHE
jgi:hypothetical protein